MALASVLANILGRSAILIQFWRLSGLVLRFREAFTKDPLENLQPVLAGAEQSKGRKPIQNATCNEQCPYGILVLSLKIAPVQQYDEEPRADDASYTGTPCINLLRSSAKYSVITDIISW